ncbi:hypothetical protein KTH_33880 [Thermosporothrix hazakensis]|nr:hypothetical protein KTH_33880 [Thermosporothrix hazakensis]
MATMQYDMAKLMGKRKATQSFRHIAAQPDQLLVLIGIHIAICPFWFVARIEGRNREVEPLNKVIQRRAIIGPVRVFSTELLKKKTGRRFSERM